MPIAIGTAMATTWRGIDPWVRSFMRVLRDVRQRRSIRVERTGA
jgi:hypothetical protein